MAGAMQSQALADMDVFLYFSSPESTSLLYPFTMQGWGCVHEGPLRREPGMGEALCRGGPPFRHQVQHGLEEAAEGVGLIFGPLVLFYQHVKQTPRLQLGDVAQVTWEKRHISIITVMNIHVWMHIFDITQRLMGNCLTLGSSTATPLWT